MAAKAEKDPKTGKWLIFCTSTIIEGVNTSAKNVVIFDEKRVQMSWISSTIAK